MLENYLQAIEGIGIYPIISMLIFISFFLVILIWIMKIDRDYLVRMSILPMDSNIEDEKFGKGDSNEK
jgi:cytochrome c oxidase cbb3-type subunit IV